MLLLYEILNVPVNAGGFDISQAYRTRCLQLIKLLGKSDAYLSFYAVSDAYQSEYKPPSCRLAQRSCDTNSGPRGQRHCATQTALLCSWTTRGRF